MTDKCKDAPGEVAEIKRIRDAAPRLDAGKAIDSPWCVVYYMVRKSIVQFQTLTARQAVRIHIPDFMEACLQVYAARELDQHGKIRNNTDFLGLPVVWGAKDFKIE